MLIPTRCTHRRLREALPGRGAALVVRVPASGAASPVGDHRPGGHFEMEPYFRERMAQDEGPWVEFIEQMRRERAAPPPVRRNRPRGRGGDD
jgi:hypothetical protein